MGWVEAVRITSSGTYSMEPSCESNTVYRIDENMPDGEFLLIENRHWSCYYDSDLKEHPNSSSGEHDRNGAAICELFIEL